MNPDTQEQAGAWWAMAHNLSRRKTLTIVLPVYNMAALLPGCLDAIKAQTRTPDCVLIIDDASMDGGVGIAVREITGHPQFDFISMGDNAGVVARMNEGLDLCKTDYIYFAAADDRIEPRFVEKLMAAAEADPGADIVHCRSIYREVDGLSWKAGSKEQPASNTVIYKTAALKAIGGFDPALKWHCDWMAYQRLSDGAVFIPEVLAVANIHSDGYCAKGRKSEEQMPILRELSRRCLMEGIPDSRMSIFGRKAIIATIGPVSLSFAVKAHVRSITATCKNALASLRRFPRIALAILTVPFALLFLIGCFSVGCFVALWCKRMRIV